MSRGGGCVRAWRRVGLPVDVTLEPSPAAGGRVTRPVRSGGGGGAGWRDHLSGDMRGPDSPCFQPPLPRNRGGGYFLCEGGVRGWRGRGICRVFSLRWGAAAAEGPQRGAALARSMWLRWGRVWDCVGAQYGAAEARGTQLRWGAAWVCDAAPHAAAQGAQRGVALGHSLRLCWGAPWSRAGGWLTGPPQV